MRLLRGHALSTFAVGLSLIVMLMTGDLSGVASVQGHEDPGRAYPVSTHGECTDGSKWKLIAEPALESDRLNVFASLLIRAQPRSRWVVEYTVEHVSRQGQGSSLHETWIGRANRSGFVEVGFADVSRWRHSFEFSASSRSIGCSGNLRMRFGRL